MRGRRRINQPTASLPFLQWVVTSPTATLVNPIRFPPGEAARTEARQFAGSVLAFDERLGRIGTIDLRSALEQHLFQVLREFVTVPEGLPQRTGVGLRRRALAVGYSGARLGVAAVRHGWWDEPPEPGAVLLIATGPTHERLFEPVAAELQMLGAPPVAVVTAGSWVRSRGAAWKRAPATGSHRVSLAIEEVLGARWLGPLAAHAARLAWRAPLVAGLAEISSERRQAVWRAVAEGVPRSALIAARLETLLQKAKPAMLVAFNEVGVWGRLIPEAAHRHGIPAIDLPHAEAADPWATVGISYDAVAVYGPRAVEAIRMAGVPRDRIVAVGSVRYDNLLRQLAGALGKSDEPAPRGRRVVLFASQWTRERGSAVTIRAVGLALDAALAAASAVAPSTVVLKPHPLEDPAVLQDLLAGFALPRGVQARVDRTTDLHELLRGTFLLVTPYSQSVFEATIAGVPAMTVHGGPGPDPVTFAEEGISVGVHDPAAAAAVAATLHASPQAWIDQVSRARAALRNRIGEVDGHAAERTARLIARVLSG